MKYQGWIESSENDRKEADYGVERKSKNIPDDVGRTEYMARLNLPMKFLSE